MPESDDDVPAVLWMPSDRAWLDPPLVMRQLYTQFTEVDTDALVSVRAAGYNVLRWGIGFSHVVYGGTVQFSPVPLLIGEGSGWQLAQFQVLWFSLPLHGPLVMGEWYMSVTSASRIRVYEAIRQA